MPAPICLPFAPRRNALVRATVVLLGAGCESPPATAERSDAASDAAPLEGGLVATAPSCTQVVITQQQPRPGPWRVVQDSQVAVRVDPDTGALRLRAPAVARTTQLTVRSDVGNASYTVEVQPTASPADLALGLAPDCAPFGAGVASGEPTTNSVLLWTWLDVAAVQGGTDPRAVRWEVSTNLAFDPVLASGAARAETANADTVQVEVSGLSADQQLYYRFVAADGAVSSLGKTRTAPGPGNQRARFALLSCSSLWSGYMGAYHNIAQRDDLDLILHVGDYIYDSVDPQEEIRIPEPFPPEPANLAEHRDRHQFYLRDPDLRAARAAHPWLVLWDNHDLLASQPPSYGGGVQAFREFVPMRLPNPAAPDVAYRTMAWGDLIDFVLMDVLIWRGRDKLPDSTEDSLLGSKQFDWLAQTLRTSKAHWRMLATQKLVSPFEAPFDGGGRTFSGYPAARQQLLELLGEDAIGSLVVLSGDAHLTIAADLLADPGDPSQPDNPYQPGTGKGAVAPEFMGASISRGNVDETLGSDAGAEFYAALHDTFMNLNPHFVMTNLVDHGYGLLDVDRSRAVAELYTVPILQWSAEAAFAGGVTALHGTRFWQRDVRREPVP